MEFIGKISVTCFAASYAIGMMGEIARVFWPHRMLRWLATSAAVMGITAQTLFLFAIFIRTGSLPIVTQFDSLITISWLMSWVYLYLLIRDRRLAAGIFILPVSLGLCLYAASLPPSAGHPLQGGRQIIGAAHGILLLVGTVAVVFALIAALMYLVKVHQLRSGTIWGGIRLPSLERLDHLHGLAVYMAWPLLTLGVGMGFALQSISWIDPKVVATVVAWGLFTILAHYRFHPENRGRKMAMLTIVASIVVLVSVLGDPLFGTVHQTPEGVG